MATMLLQFRGNIVGVQFILKPKRKLTNILNSKATCEEHINVCDEIEIDSMTSPGQGSVWSTLKIGLSVNHDARLIFCTWKGE